MRAERVSETACVHAEGPVWWPRLGTMRCLDMLAGAVMTLRPDGGLDRTPVGSAIAAGCRPRAGGGAIIAREHDLVVADTDDLGELRVVATLTDDANIRLNEVAVDPLGRFYAGSMSYDRTPNLGTYWRLDALDLEPVAAIEAASTSNGLAWSPDGTRAYFDDTPSERTDVFDVTPDGELHNRRPFADVSALGGRPDGLCVDAEGGVWVALYRGGCVRRYASDGTLSQVVELPVTLTSSCAFGGADLDVLYVTTSRDGLVDGEQPEAGSLWAVRPGVRGLPLPDVAF